jgi:hypothetical protein
MKKIILFIAVCLLLFQCKKSTLHDLSGTATLKGVVITFDTLHGAPAIILQKNSKVFLKYAGSASSFLYSTTTNDQAQFSFTGIELNQSYTIYSSSDTGSVKYAGRLDYEADKFTDGQSDTLKLYPSPDNQNGIHLIVMDSLDARVANVTAWVFNSQVLFAADTSAGRVFDMKSNNYGIDNLLNIAPGLYYLRIKVKIGNLDLAGETSVNVSPGEIKTAIIHLRSIPLANRNGMELQLNDIFGTPVYNASVYCYRSRAVWLLDSTETNSIFVLHSTAAGLASTYLIDSARYYLRMIKPVSSKDTLRRVDSIDVGKAVISKKTFVLLPQ